MSSVLLLTQKYNEDDPLTAYCHKIANHLADKGMETHLVCFGEDRDTKINNLHLHEVGFKLHGDNYFSWSMLVQSAFTRKIRELSENNDVSVIHANDWFTIPASLISTKILRKPLLVTYHSIENERGMHNPHSGQISEIEWEGASAASYVIVHEQSTLDALEPFDLPEKKIKFLNDDDWLDKIHNIYKQMQNINNNEKESSDNDENFNAYMGVPSS